MGPRHPWDDLIRLVAGYDHDKAERVLYWPLEEALLALRDKMQRDALAAWQSERLIYAVLAPWVKKGGMQPPPVPPILRSLIRG